MLPIHVYIHNTMLTLKQMFNVFLFFLAPYFKDVCEHNQEEEEFKLKLKEAKEEASTEKKTAEAEEKVEELKPDEIEAEN